MKKQKRVTEKKIKALVDRLNIITDSPMHTWLLSLPDNKYRSQIGNYYLSYDYSGVSLYRVCNDVGGVENICFFLSKKDMFCRLEAYISEIYDGRLELGIKGESK